MRVRAGILIGRFDRRDDMGGTLLFSSFERFGSPRLFAWKASQSSLIKISNGEKGPRGVRVVLQLGTTSSARPPVCPLACSLASPLVLLSRVCDSNES